MRTRRILAAFFVLFIVLSAIRPGHAAAQATIHVPVDQPTIQAGINAANNGDTVLVATGTYFENIDFKGKAITVTSSAGPATTIIDGGSAGAAVTFKTSETRASILSNFTIQHGGNYGNFSGGQNLPIAGGIEITQSSPTILNNVITLSTCWGIHFNLAAPLIQGNEISATQDPNGRCSIGGGAGILAGGYLSQPPGAVTPSLIIANTIENNVESGNEDGGGNGGAAIAVFGGSTLIENNILRNNSSPGGSGGAINIVFGYQISIVQNLIYGNSAGCGGGSIAFMQPAPSGALNILIANNTIVNNTGFSRAGYSNCASISQIYPDPGTYGGGNTSTIIVNNILDGSVPYPAVNCGWFDPPSEFGQPIFDHNILYNAGGPFFGSYCVDVSGKYGNISADPRFVNPSVNDFHLTANSPAIDAGNNSALLLFEMLSGNQLTKDLDGNTRVQDASAKGYPIIDIGAYEFAGAADATPTTVVLTSSAYTGSAGNNYTLTATLAATPIGIPTGPVTFYMDGNPIGTSNIVATSAGLATLSNVAMTPGVHSLYAFYPGQSSFPPATSVIIIVDISGSPTTLSLASSANPSPFGQPVTFTATVTNTSTTPGAPTGNVTFSDGATVLATQPLSSTGSITATATFSSSTLSVGTHPITATYTPAGTFAGSTGSLSQVITGLTTTTALTSSLNPSSVGQSVTFSATVSSTSSPTGSVTFSDGATVLATRSLASTSSAAAAATFSTTSLAAGIHTIIATYVPTGGFAASSAQLTQTVNALPSSTTLTAAPNPTLFGTAVTLTAAVTGTSGTPTGNITFYDGASVLAIISLDTSGHAAFTTSTLAVGSHSLSAAYAGSSTYAASASPPVIEVIQPLPQDFTITLASPAITIRTQHHTTTTLTLASINGFADSLAITCANLPQYVTCQPTPSTAALAANGTSTVSLYLDTDSVLGYARNAPAAPPGRRASPIALALLLPFGFTVSLVFSRTSRRTAAPLRLLALLFALLPLSLALAGCGEIILAYDPPPSAAPGTYTIPITATGATTHIAHTANLTLTVTP